MPYLLRTVPDPEPLDCRILTAALELFVDRGYHNVSVHDIQKRAGVSIGSIYNHFGGKEGVARALYDHLLMELDELIDIVEQEVGGLRAQCNAMIRRLFGFTETHRYMIAFVFDAKHTEFLSESVPINRTRPFVRLLGKITAAIKAGELKPIAPVVAYTLIFGSCVRLVNLRLDGLIDDPLMAYFDELTDTVWAGLATAD
ncbi:MAG: TetR/AcrR family transcriptional regulator [Gammaproteobacteria bacterium]|nr:TetR/AcrR family transcriptional regulator [Gammaproteobacteria bacterium]MCP5424300.1 TetR/AcrR family transcriptional regulator [Gammaproteobacteria bacterium]MCP5459053.1 TetR/AcrR family transcriptional regulator [Gammaproteobacteria bacterium]